MSGRDVAEPHLVEEIVDRFRRRRRHRSVGSSQLLVPCVVLRFAGAMRPEYKVLKPVICEDFRYATGVDCRLKLRLAAATPLRILQDDASQLQRAYTRVTQYPSAE